MTVGELRKVMEGLADDAQVIHSPGAGQDWENDTGELIPASATEVCSAELGWCRLYSFAFVTAKPDDAEQAGWQPAVCLWTE